MVENTLVTFLLPNIHKAGSVDLYGSWDNFRRAYAMQKDHQMGHGQWTCCPDFTGVICHGDPSDCNMPQDEPLRMEGTYWYYYVSDGDVEFHNPLERSTNSCPLLPGQTVNELYIPRLVSSAFDPGLTLDRRQRWAPLRPSSDPLLTPVDRTLADGVRTEWFKESLGRLQTSVVENLLSGFRGFALDDKPERPGLLGRRTRTANARFVPTFRQCHGRGDRDVERPQTQHGPKTAGFVRPSSSSAFQNPFMDASLASSRHGTAHSVPSSSSLSSPERPQTCIDFRTDDAYDIGDIPLPRPNTAPELAARQDEEASIPVPQDPVLPHRRRTDPYDERRQGQVFADALEAMNQLTVEEPEPDTEEQEAGTSPDEDVWTPATSPSIGALAFERAEDASKDSNRGSLDFSDFNF